MPGVHQHRPRSTGRRRVRSNRPLEVERLVRADLPLLTQGVIPRLRLLEIGCGIGRMTRALAEIFGEVYATDVSGEMIRRGSDACAIVRTSFSPNQWCRFPFIRRSVFRRHLLRVRLPARAERRRDPRQPRRRVSRAPTRRVFKFQTTASPTKRSASAQGHLVGRRL